MKKLIGLLACVLILSGLLSGFVYANMSAPSASVTYDELGIRYQICPEMIEAIGNVDPRMRLTNDEIDDEVKALHSLYCEYEDNYEVLTRYLIPNNNATFKTLDDKVIYILELAHDLEVKHGKA